MTEWYECTEEERIKNIYSKYTIKQFWDWWSNSENKIMEVRIKDYLLIKETANTFDLHYSTSGVYVNNSEELKNVIAFVRNKATIWMGYNPRRKNWQQNGNKGYGSGARGGSSEYNVEEIKFIFIDIDRVKKQQQATNEELKRCDILANLILEQLGKEGWNKSFIKSCSGNGIQLLIKLDEAFTLSNVNFDNKLKIFVEDSEFTKLRNVLHNVGKQIISFIKKNMFNSELEVDVDKTCFRISQVCALPFTKNFKYSGFTWRGILEIQDGVNSGISDWILSKIDDSLSYKEKNVFKHNIVTDYKNKLFPNKIIDNPLIQFMLKTNLPYGSINNRLWFQLKCLIRDAGLDFSHPVIKQVHKQLEQKFKGQLSINLPEARFMFNEDIVNAYCRDNLIPPLYTVRKTATKKFLYLKQYSWEMKDITVIKNIELTEDSITKDMYKIKGMFIEDINYNEMLVGAFINSCIDKYGEERTKYYFNYWMYKYLYYE